VEGFESCLDGVNRQAETFSTKTRYELGKTGSAVSKPVLPVCMSSTKEWDIN
jgi:hypothetical protein